MLSIAIDGFWWLGYSFHDRAIYRLSMCYLYAFYTICQNIGRISVKYFPFELLPETLFAQRAEDIGGPAPGLSKYGPGADSRSQPSFGRSPWSTGNGWMTPKHHTRDGSCISISWTKKRKRKAVWPLMSGLAAFQITRWFFTILHPNLQIYTFACANPKNAKN